MDERIIAKVRAATPLTASQDLDSLVNELAEAHIVLLGGASYGTSEFHSWRADITKRLIAEKGFFLIGVEGDWSACRRVNRYIAGLSDEDLSSAAVLNASFERWPTWMWANREFASLAGWLRQHNRHLPAGARPARLYGLDLYDQWECFDAIGRYFEQTARNGEARAHGVCERTESFEGLRVHPSGPYLVPDACCDAIVALFGRPRASRQRYPEDGDAPLQARRDALVGAGARTYYRQFLRGGTGCWNHRARQMAESAEAIVRFYDRKYRTAGKIVIWAHNAQVGDARATRAMSRGVSNLGQLLRGTLGQQVAAAGFISFQGRTIAAGAWEGLMQDVELPEAPQGSWEHTFHRAGGESRIVRMSETFAKERDQRLVGVVYDPENDESSYLPTILARAYDYVVFIDQSSPLQSLSLACQRRATEGT